MLDLHLYTRLQKIEKQHLENEYTITCNIACCTRWDNRSIWADAIFFRAGSLDLFDTVSSKSNICSSN